jgi:multiple sugar transport system permease protein
LFKNFIEIFKAKSFHDALKNTFLFFLGELIPQWILAFWLAAVITDRRLRIKGRGIFKTAFFFPKLVAGSAWGMVLLNYMIAFFGTAAGMAIAASMINGFGFEPEDFEFFTSVQFFIIIITVFLQFGITFIYAIAGITGIPVEIFEAAEMDGAGRVQTFFRITLPCMKPMLFFITIVSIIEGLGMADVPRAFGSFDSLRKNLTLMMYLENQAFMGSYAYDRAAAASVIQLGIYLLIAGIVYFILIRDKDEARLKKMMRQQKREAAILKQT